MYFSWSPRKVPKEGDLRRRYEKAPSLKILPPPRHSVSKNVPIFGHLQFKNFRFSQCRHPKIGTFSGVEWSCGGGFQRGRIFVAPLWLASFGSFLASQEKNITALTKRYTLLQAKACIRSSVPDGRLRRTVRGSGIPGQRRLPSERCFRCRLSSRFLPHFRSRCGDSAR